MTIEILGHLIQTEKVMYISRLSHSREYLNEYQRKARPENWYLIFTIHFAKEVYLELRFFEKGKVGERTSEEFYNSILQIRNNILSHNSEIKVLHSELIDTEISK